MANLEADGYLTRTRVGRRVIYTVNRDSMDRHPAQQGLRVGPFLDLFAGGGPNTPPGNRTGAEPEASYTRAPKSNEAEPKSSDRPS